MIYSKELYLVRRRLEKRIAKQQINGFYVCSLSFESIIYKGLFLAEQLSIFYPDLANHNFVSSYAVFHQRYSTNTFPSWGLAQPFRMLAHNGEINTIQSNLSWMKAREVDASSSFWKDDIEKLNHLLMMEFLILVN